MSKSGNKILIIALSCVIVSVVLTLFLESQYRKSSSNESCASCHVHPHAEVSWKQSSHYSNPSGTKTDCSACHLPPEGSLDHFVEKMKVGSKDLASYILKDKSKIDWEAKRTQEYAPKIVYDASCLNCHVNLYPQGISDDGVSAHLYYDKNREKYDLHCTGCHLDAGHYIEGYAHSRMAPEKMTLSNTLKFESASTITAFESFIETVPGTGVLIKMIAIPGGTFLMGSPEDEPLRNADEGPQRTVSVSPFFMAETEITWDQYWAFYNETMSEGRTSPEIVYANNNNPEVDAVSGPTPPFGSPDQGWGMGSRPAITMTWYAARTFCQWLSLKTGKTYRLPTEAEWEYAARCGTSTPYFFPGDPKKFEGRGLRGRIFGTDTTNINRYAVYALNSSGRTSEGRDVAANPFGLKNMYGNVMEYCSDWYDEKAYSSLEDGTVDPKGPSSGKEHVVRGGSYSSPASHLRSAARSHSFSEEWLKTDPQNPKSIWWYSDIKGIGFRVVCEVPEGLK